MTCIDHSNGPQLLYSASYTDSTYTKHLAQFIFGRYFITGFP